MSSMFVSLYKTRTSTQYATTQERIEVSDNLRRESRWTALLQRRNINAFMSPINSPHASAKKIDKSVIKKVKNGRLEQLMKWKEQKKKKLEATKANSKPIFKVCHVKEVLRPDLNEIYGKIKGKETFKLAPTSTYKFKPPSNIKPLNMNTKHCNANVKRRLNFKEDLGKDANKIKVDTNNSIKKLSSTNNTMKKPKSPKVKMVVDVIGSISTNNSMKKLKNTKVEMMNVVEETIPSSEQRISTDNSMKKLKGRKVKMVDVIEEKILTSGRISTNKSMKKLKNTKVDMINVTEETIPSSEQRISTNNTMKKLKSPKAQMVDVIEEKILTSGSISTNNSMQKLKNTMVEMINVAEETIPSSEQRISTNNSMGKLKSPKTKVVNVSEETIISPVEKIQTPIQLKNIPVDSQVNTPLKDITYISPFITTSRGKENSRREYNERRSNFYESPTISALQKNKTAAAYFEKLLREEEQRLNELCSKWEAYENSENPPEEACDMIRVAIGQTKLLLRKKFGKFKELISECRCPTSEKIVTCLDLHGFWDIIQIQLNNLDGRFENLDRLKGSNWEEIVPPPLSKKQRRPKKNNVKKKEVKSSLKDLIKEQRKKHVLKENKKSPMIVVSTPRGRLLNISNTTFPQSHTVTPIINLGRINTPKSILKSGHSPKNRSIRKTKSVLFRESVDKENVLDSSNLIQFSPESSLRQYPRRSNRLAEKRINC